MNKVHFKKRHILCKKKNRLLRTCEPYYFHSSHPLSSFYLGLGHGGSSLFKYAEAFPSPANSFSSYGGIQVCSQSSRETMSFQCQKSQKSWLEQGQVASPGLASLGPQLGGRPEVGARRFKSLEWCRIHSSVAPPLTGELVREGLWLYWSKVEESLPTVHTLLRKLLFKKYIRENELLRPN